MGINFTKKNPLNIVLKSVLNFKFNAKMILVKVSNLKRGIELMTCNLGQCCAQELDYQKQMIHDALIALGKKNLALIVHGNSFPSCEGRNTGFGSPNSQAGRDLIDFASGIFNAIQLGPAGKTKGIDASPYTGTIFSTNPLFIDLEKLTWDEWGNILSWDTYNNICENNPNKDTNRTAYSYIFEAQETALKEAWYSFRDRGRQDLKDWFNWYKGENWYWIEKDSIYEALTLEHGNDYWKNWDSEIDKNLFNPKNKKEEAASAERLNEIKSKYYDEIEYYAFCQFVAYVQNEKTKEYAASKGIKMIADRQVAFSDRDIWAYQSLFLDGWMLGCPPDYFTEDGQAWGFPVVDPKKMFDKAGKLGDAGILLKRLYSKMFKENPGGVRIDHVVGLIDPWVYKVGCKPRPEEGAGRLYSSPEHSELSKYAIAKKANLNNEVGSDKEKRIKKLSAEQVEKYGWFLKKIVIAAAKENGLTKDAIICEDLGTMTYPVCQVMADLKLQGMRLTQFVLPEVPEHPYRCCNIEKKVWAMVGTHDNEPIAMWADKLVNTHEAYLHALNLVADLYPDKSEEETEAMIKRLTTDNKYLTQVKLTEMFASTAENIQIFFTDFFGVKEVYNMPGTSGDHNWSLRMPNNFGEYYCNSLCEGNGINLPQILAFAIKARGNKFAKKHGELLSRLEEFN